MVMMGVTGTNGKTTTTYLLKHILEVCMDAKVGLIGTNGNMIGDEFLPTERTTPESYELQKLLREMADAGCTHVVMEVSSHSLALDRVAGITYDCGIFTNLTQDHLDFHHDMRDLRRGQGEALCYEPLRRHKPGRRVVAVHAQPCPVPLHDLLTQGQPGRRVRPGHPLHQRLGELPRRVQDGRRARHAAHSRAPSRCITPWTVLTCGLALGIELGDCADAIASAHGVKGRMETVPTDGDYTILIDYAHTPDALENVLESVREVASGRLVALFGCGGDRDRTKRPIMGRIASEIADLVIVTSDNPRTKARGHHRRHPRGHEGQLHAPRGHNGPY